MKLSEELKWRGFFNQTTIKDLGLIDDNKIKFYFGVDPSSDSMQIGNLASAMMNKLFIDHGHEAYLLVGGATGLIGDPDGKDEERDLKSFEQVEKNKAGIAAQYDKVFAGQKFTLVDNYDWFKDMDYLTFLREVGKHVPMRQMLGREFVKSRLSEDGAGISYAEFSYSLIQGYDFLHLHQTYGVNLQLCGADQWGNSIAGIDLIRRKTGEETHVWSSPLIINKATGKKFGKSEDGAIFLDENKTSVYKFYQFWINCDDEGIEDYIKVYTTFDKNKVDSLIAEHNEDKSKRIAQKQLAYEVTKTVHGEARAQSMRKLSEVLFGSSDYKELSREDFELLESELTTVTVDNDSDILDVLVETGLAGSKGEARRFISSGGIYINGEQISDQKLQIIASDFVDVYCVLRRGKNSNALLKSN